MKKVFCLLFLLVLSSCGEKLLEKPEDLIPKEKMIDILKDFTILNSAKNTNANVFHDNKIEPTSFIFSKYGIDSLQFVVSDRYYASLPDEYEAIYEEIDRQLEEERTFLQEGKKIKDSLEKKKKLSKSPIKKPKSTTIGDSLQ